MVEIIKFGDLQQKKKKPRKEKGESFSKKGKETIDDSKIKSINSHKIELIQKMMASSRGHSRETLENAEKYFKGWTDEEIIDFINNSGEAEMRRKPTLFIYAYEIVKEGGDLFIAKILETLEELKKGNVTKSSSDKKQSNLKIVE